MKPVVRPTQNQDTQDLQFPPEWIQALKFTLHVSEVLKLTEDQRDLKIEIFKILILD